MLVATAKNDLSHLGLKEGEFYISENCKHAANTRLYKTMYTDSLDFLVVKGMKGERGRKQIQFALGFHMLAQGGPMLEYKACLFVQVFACPWAAKAALVRQCRLGNG